jgi:hypothetical protein
MFSLFRRRPVTTPRFSWVPAVDLSNARVMVTLMSLSGR